MGFLRRIFSPVQSCSVPLTLSAPRSADSIPTARRFSFRAYGIVLGLVLLTAAVSKGWQAATSIETFALGVDFPWITGVVLALFEAGLAAWLFCGVRPPVLHAVAILTFAAYAMASLYFISSGVATCACLGVIETSPWLMLLIDLCALGGLCVLRPEATSAWTPVLCRGITVYAAIVAGIAAPLGVHAAWLRMSSVSSAARIELPNGTYLRLVQAERSAPDFVDGELLIRSAGAEALQYELTATCGCTTQEPRAGVVAPGETVRVAVRMRLDNMARRAAQIHIHCNDPRSPQVVDVLAERRVLVRTVPEAIDFQTLSLGQSVSRRLDVYVVEERYRHVLSQASVRARSPHVRITALDDGSECRSWLVSWATGPRAALLNDVVEVLGADGATLTEVAVRGKAVPLVQSVPPKIVLPEGSDGAATFFVVRPDGKALGPLVACDAPPGVTISELDPGESAKRCYRLSQSNSQTDASTYCLRLHFAPPRGDEPLVAELRVSR